MSVHSSRRVLVIASSLSPNNGWSTIARHTVEGLLERGHEVVAVLETDDGNGLCPVVPGLPRANDLMGWSPLAWLRTARILRRALRQWRPDVIHIAVEPYALALPILRWMMRLPPTLLILLGTYTVLPLHWRSNRWLMKRVYAQTDAFLSCSEFTRSQALSALATFCSPALRDRVSMRTQIFRLGIAATPLRTPPSNATKRIVFMGMVKDRKGVLELVRACAVLQRRGEVSFHLDIIGAYQEERPYIRALRDFIRSAQLENVVSLRGHLPREEVALALAQADLFVMLSKQSGVDFEGFGMVFLEANMQGIPVIGPDGSGCKEAIDDGVSGYTVDPNDSEAVADRMTQVLRHNAIAPSSCRAWAERHSVAQQTAAFEAAYERMWAA